MFHENIIKLKESYQEPGIDMKKKPAESFSTTLSKECKEAMSLFCVRRGMKINHFLEEIIWDRLEEEMDAEIAKGTDYSDLVDLKKLTGSKG
jgi:hypothetical protein